MSTFWGDAVDWFCWRGPDRNGISTETNWISDWAGGSPPVLWQASVGQGFSSVTTGNGRLYTMGLNGPTETIYCLNAETGESLWTYSYPSTFKPKFYEGGTSGTPTIDNDRVYVLGQMGELFCFNTGTGAVVWSKNIHDEVKAEIPTWGFTGAPLVHGDSLILNVGSHGTAVHKMTGEVLWTSGTGTAAFSTPLPFEYDDQVEILIFVEKELCAVDPGSGKLLWSFPWNTRYGVNAADPVLAEDRIFISSGYGKGAALLDLRSGKPKAVWESKNLRTQTNPAVFIDKYVFGIDGDTTQKAVLRCLELATGKVLWTREGIGSGAVTVADDKLIVISDKGELMIAPVSPDSFEPLTRAQVLGGKCWTVPVLSNGRLYCRNSRGDLVCLDVREEG